MIANKITLWSRRGWFTKEKYLFTYGYSSDENLMGEISKVMIMFPTLLIKSEQCEVQ